MKQKEIKKLNKGITLIALVITIIVLLILAGVSIAMLTGENGILSQAQKAGEQTDIGQEKEAIALAYNGAKAENNGGDVDADDLNRNFGYNDTDATAKGSNPITVTFKESGRQYTIDENGVISDPIEANIIASIRIEGEKSEGTPPMPSDEFSYVTGTVDDGYVIEDKNKNQYVWIPVDKNQKLKVNVTSKNNIESITLTNPYGDEQELENVASQEIDLVGNENYINGLYKLTVVAGGETKEVELDVNSLYATRMWELDMLTEEIAQALGYSDLNTFVQDRFGSGIEETKNMIIQTYKGGTFSETEDYTDSINENGGFYIGRYEASENNGVTEIKANKAPRRDISQTDALAKANDMYDSQEFTSSLLTGSAWDRTLGWLEETEAVTSFEIVGDSKTWGNYSDDEFENSEGLQNTGSIPQTEKNHIFDLAGNLREWTREAISSGNRVYRGGDYVDPGSDYPCSLRSGDSPDSTPYTLGFRLALYL